MGSHAVGEGPKDDAVVVLEMVAEGVGVVVLRLSSFFCVTTQYDCQSHHGVQSRPTEGFHSWNSAGETKSFSWNSTSSTHVLLTAPIFSDVLASLATVGNVLPFSAVFGRIRVKLKARFPSGCYQMDESRK
jgi:hypothetical protein